MESPSGTAPAPQQGGPTARFNFPGWNHHPEPSSRSPHLAQRRRPVSNSRMESPSGTRDGPGAAAAAGHVSTSPDGITIRNLLTGEIIAMHLLFVSTSPDGITIRNWSWLGMLWSGGQGGFNFPGWNHHPERWPGRSHGPVAPSGFNFPGWNHHPEQLWRLGGVPRQRSFQLPRMESPSGTRPVGRLLRPAGRVSTSPDGITIRN